MIFGFFSIQVDDYEGTLQMFLFSDLESKLGSWKGDLEDDLFAANPTIVVLHRRTTSTNQR
jgi:hypothetical protein